MKDMIEVIISQYGETRDITVIGQPKTPFEITVNRITESKQTVSDQTNPRTDFLYARRTDVKQAVNRQPVFRHKHR